MTGELDARLAELDAAAARLRALDADADADDEVAAALVGRCAELATEIAAELDRRARESQLEPSAPESPDQERLL